MTGGRPGGWFPVRPGVRAGDLAMLEVLGGIVRSADPVPLGNAGDGSRILGVLWGNRTVTTSAPGHGPG